MTQSGHERPIFARIRRAYQRLLAHRPTVLERALIDRLAKAEAVARSTRQPRLPTSIAPTVSPGKPAPSSIALLPSASWLGVSPSRPSRKSWGCDERPSCRERWCRKPLWKVSPRAGAHRALSIWPLQQEWQVACWITQSMRARLVRCWPCYRAAGQPNRRRRLGLAKPQWSRTSSPGLPNKARKWTCRLEAAEA